MVRNSNTASDTSFQGLRDAWHCNSISETYNSTERARLLQHTLHRNSQNLATANHNNNILCDLQHKRTTKHNRNNHNNRRILRINTETTRQSNNPAAPNSPNNMAEQLLAKEEIDKPASKHLLNFSIFLMG